MLVLMDLLESCSEITVFLSGFCFFFLAHQLFSSFFFFYILNTKTLNPIKHLSLSCLSLTVAWDCGHVAETGCLKAVFFFFRFFLFWFCT